MKENASMCNEHKLMLCPFCGGNAHIYQDYTGMYVAQCDKCGIGTLLCGDAKTAKRRWNKRVKDGVNGLELEIDGAIGYFPKPYIAEAIKTHQNKGDRKNLIKEIVALSEENETLKDNNEHLAVMLTEAKAEVAREIFEEIDKELVDVCDEYRYHMNINGVLYTNGARSIIAELKKKYTEGET